jgi:hypothetical protein
MPMTLSSKCRRNLACAGVVAVALATSAWYSERARGEVVDTASQPGVVAYRMGNFRYEYHAPSGTESLFDLDRDPRCVVNVIRENRTVAADCRRRIEAHLGISNLASLRANHADTIRRLEALGYL